MLSVHRGSGTIEIDAINLENKVIPETLSNNFGHHIISWEHYLLDLKKLKCIFQVVCNIGFSSH